MSLKEKLAEDLKSSMKNKNTVRKNTVQLVRTAILQVGNGMLDGISS